MTLNITSKKIFLSILISSIFVSGYLPGFNFDVFGISINIYRCILCFSVFTCAILLFQKKILLAGISSQIIKNAIVFLASLVLVGLIHIIIGNIYNNSFAELLVIVFNLSLLMCCALLVGNDLLLWKFLKKIIKYIGIIISLFGCFEIVTGFVFQGSRYKEIEFLQSQTVHPATGYFTNENNLAALMIIIFALIVSDIISSKNTKELLIYIIQSVIVLVPMMMTDSTIFMIGTYMCVVAATIITISIYGKGLKPLAKCSLLSGVVIMLDLFKKYIRAFFILINRLYFSFNISNLNEHINGVDNKSDSVNKVINGDGIISQIQNTGMGTVTIRKNLFLCGVDASKDNLIIGHGPNSFPSIFKGNEQFLELTGGMINPHNFIVEILVQYGLILCIFFLFICFYVFLGSSRKIFDKKLDIRTKLYSGEILIIIIAFAFSTILPSSFISATEYFIGFLLLIIGYSCISYNKER